MGTEIERKFLVTKDWKLAANIIGSNHIRQGYLSVDPERTTRIRIQESCGYITLKGITAGCTRVEFEYSIPPKQVSEMINTLCEYTIEKVRHRVKDTGFGIKVWEVDEFLGDNYGLVVAELELDDENEKYHKPKWVTKEVTEDPRYYNSNLAQKPFNTWGEHDD